MTRLDAYGDPLPEGALSRLGSLRFRPGSGACAVAFLPGGNILSGNADGLLREVDWSSGKVVRVIGTKGSFVEVLKLSPDGLVAYTGGANLLGAWNLRGGEPLFTRPSMQPVIGMAVIRRGTQVV